MGTNASEVPIASSFRVILPTVIMQMLPCFLYHWGRFHISGVCYVVQLIACAQLNNITHDTTTTSAHRPPTFTVHDYSKPFLPFK
jgi:hypothetical protein